MEYSQRERRKMVKVNEKEGKVNQGLSVFGVELNVINMRVSVVSGKIIGQLLFRDSPTRK